MVHDVGAVEEFEPGRLTLRQVGRREVGILLFGDGDGGVAIRNTCPHAGAPLCLGVVAPMMVGDAAEAPAGAVGEVGDRLVLSCPWHGWEFDVVSGRALADAKLRVKTYPVVVENDRVLLEI